MRAWWAVAVATFATTAAWAEPAFEQVNLVSDGVVPGTRTDPNLMNPWGLAHGPTTPWWVANNGTGTATVYDGNGVPQPPANPLVVTIPGATGGQGAPTGEVFYGGNKFIVSDMAGHMGPARFIFAGEDGVITAWSPNVPPTTPPPSRQAFIMFDATADNAVFKGLAIATDCEGETHLYATDFRNARVVVIDDEFNAVDLGDDAFVDRDRKNPLPKGYAPFGIRAFGERIFVTYALQKPDKHDDQAGPGHGFVDEYDLDGNFIRRVASRGALNSPWGLEIAPKAFGRFDDALLVGNFGDGTIQVYERRGGRFEFEDTLSDVNGEPIVINGLWSIARGNDGPAGSSQQLFFSAGINDEKDGLFGFIRRVHH